MHAAAAFAANDARDAGRCHLHNERRTDAPQTPNARTILLSLIEKSVFRVNSFPAKNGRGDRGARIIDATSTLLPTIPTITCSAERS